MHEPSFDEYGLVTLTLLQLRENLRESVETSSDLGAEVSTGNDTIAGMILDAAAVNIEPLYRLLDDLWASWDVNQAEGVALDNQNQLRGVIRNPERNSTVILRLSGDAATPIPAGSIAAIPNDGARWLTDTAVVIPDLGGGVGYIDVNATAEDAGPVLASANTITDIISGVTGWDTVTNPADQASIGELVESDADYRLRGEGGSTGSTTEEAIYTRLTEIDTVDAAVVTSNRGETVDANGTPGHTMWIIVHPATVDPQTIAETIWGEAGAPAGIGFRGAQTATVTDTTSGETHQIRWDWATELDLYVSVVGTKDANYPAGGDTLVKDAITDYFSVARVGQDVYPAPVEGAVTTGPLAVPGIMTLDALLKIGSPPAPTDTDPIDVAINEFAELNTTIGVTIT
jgi:hypothetical protein